MKINNLEIGNIFLAPMAGVTDVGFRHICKLTGADLTFTEMVSAKALSYDSAKTKELLYTSDIESPKAVQIFGHEPDVMAKVCQMEELSKFDLIDINFGCPAPKIVNNGDGSAILKDLKLLEQIVSSCVKASSKPISCKFRKGYFAEDNVAVDVARICEDSGAKMITIHGRTRSQMYSGLVDLETIAKVKAVVKIPVVGNGDIVDNESYNKMLSTGVDAVMIGRGALGNPNIFATLKNNQPIDKYTLLLEHINMLKNYFSDKYITTTMRKHLLWYVAGEPNATAYKRELATTQDINASLQIVKKILLNK